MELSAFESLNQRTNGPVNAHLISGPIQNLDKMAEKTLTLITNNPHLTHSVNSLRKFSIRHQILHNV